MFKLELGEYIIEDPYGDQPSSVAIIHSSGEGGNFDKKKLIEVLAEAVHKFYKENF